MPKLADELDDKLIDEALGQMARLLGPEFVAECEAGYIHHCLIDTKKLKRTEKKDDDIGK